MKKILLFLWQLPQNILGLFLLFLNLPSMIKKNMADVDYFEVKHLFGSGISLGHFIIIDKDQKISEETVKHEHGHQIQSLYLGPLYLIVIGLPSIMGNIFGRFICVGKTRKEMIEWYYSQPWEAWADKLGDVHREY